MFLEFDWTFSVFRVRFGDAFTDFRGQRSFCSLGEARRALAFAGLALGRKTDTRTWAIVADSAGQRAAQAALDAVLARREAR